LLVLSACTGQYFRSVDTPFEEPIQYTLANWPTGEYWTGLIFNGEKIGFTHLNIAPASSEPGRYDITAECVMLFSFLGFKKRIELRSYDQVGEDLTLVKFDYDYDLDGNRVKIRGEHVDETLKIDVDSRGQVTHQSVTLENPIFPTSIIQLYPVVNGLAKGRQYTYEVYSGETRTIHKVEQQITAYEESELFQGKAFRVKTRFQGQTATTWIDNRGRPVLEMSLNGIIISTLEDRKRAEKYLFQAAFNKSETMIDYSRIESNLEIKSPRETTYLEVTFSGMPENFCPPSDRRQHCMCEAGNALCKVNNDYSGRAEPHISGEKIREEYLKPSIVVPSISRPIIDTAATITAGESDPAIQVSRLVTWIEKNIEQKPVDVFTALDVLAGRKAECQGHAILYAAFARSLGIPTRVVNGVVFSSYHKGFLYHTWAESMIEDVWIAIDPTFHQIPADATHIKLVEGEELKDLLPLIGLIGKLEAKIQFYSH